VSRRPADFGMISGHLWVIQEYSSLRVNSFAGSSDINSVNDFNPLCLLKFIKPFYVMIYHRFDRIIRPGFKPLHPSQALSSPSIQQRNWPMPASGGVSRKGYVGWLHLT
jgi:hypothetical protein